MNPVLNDYQLKAQAPSIFATEPAEFVSDRYNFIPTIDVVNGLRDNGWHPVEVQQVAARNSDNMLTNKHLIKFEHPDIAPVGGIIPQAIMTNSHNRASAFQFMMGLFRFVCANGLVTADEMFGKISVRHNSGAIEESIEACFKMLEQAPQVIEKVDAFKQIELTPDEQVIFARSALNYRYGAHGTAESKPLVVYGRPRQIELAMQEVEGTDKQVTYIPFTPEQMLRVRRSADTGSDLWSVYNKIQENVVKGGARGMSEKWRRTSMREIKSIDESVKTNKALWGMAQYMSEHAAAVNA